MTISAKVAVSGYGYGPAHWSGTPGTQTTLCGRRYERMHGKPDIARMCKTCAKAMAKLVKAARTEANVEQSYRDQQEILGNARAEAHGKTADERCTEGPCASIRGDQDVLDETTSGRLVSFPAPIGQGSRAWEIAYQRPQASVTGTKVVKADTLSGARQAFYAAVPDGIIVTSEERLVSKLQEPELEIHTAGLLHGVPDIRPTFTFDLSELLDDPAHKPDADLVRRDGRDHRMQDFVFFTEGALDLYKDIKLTIGRQLERGKSVRVLILCNGGKHRSVAFGDNLAQEFDVAAKHHHVDRPIVPKVEHRMIDLANVKIVKGQRWVCTNPGMEGDIVTITKAPGDGPELRYKIESNGSTWNMYVRNFLVQFVPEQV